MTKPEQQWAWALTQEKQQHIIHDFYFEQVTLYLSDPQRGTKRVSYTPDFVVIMTDGSTRIDEIKGPFIREDSELKFKIAADRFPWFHWRMIQIDKRGVRVIRDLPIKGPQKPRGEKKSAVEALGVE